MSLGKVHARILIAGAWLAGAGIATAGSLYSVSLLGHGILGPSSQQLTVAAVNRALASETAEPPASPARPPAAPARTSATPLPSATRPSPAGAGSAAARTLLSSPGGSVVAGCTATGAYLLSWTPQQGFQASSVVRGPAPRAQVLFRSGRTRIAMVVTCHGGVPSATTVTTGGQGED